MSAATAAIRPKLAAKGRFRPELELLLAASAPPSGNARHHHLEDCIDQPLDWQLLLELADTHGLSALLFWNIQGFAHAAPAAHFAKLRAQYESNARKNLLLTRMLVEAQESLSRGGVECLAWKGPTLALRAYHDVALREFSDLDLLLRVNDIPRAKEILIASGYQPVLRLTAAQERAYLKLDNELPFHRGAQENVLELQWRLVPYFYAVDFDWEGQFQRAVPVSVGDAECRTLCNEDLLLSLCVHAAKHAWSRLSWIGDIAWLLKTQNLDWVQVQHEAESVGIERIVLVTLALSRHFYGTSLPRVAQMEIGESLEVQRLSLQIANRIVQGGTLDISSPDYFLLMCRMRERWRDRARLLKRLAFMSGPGEWTKLSLPRPLAPLYLAIRAFRLSGKLVALLCR